MDTYSVRKIARLRSRTFVCKANHKSSYGMNLSCRAGCSELETQDHLINCTTIQGEVEWLDCEFLKKGDLESHPGKLKELLRRMDIAENWCSE